MSSQHPAPLHLDDDGNILKATLIGYSSLDRMNGHEAAEQLCQFFNEHGRRQLQLDFKNIRRISSIGLSGLLMLRKRLQGIVGRITFINVPDDVLEVMAIFAFDRLFSIVKSSDSPG